MTILEKLFGPKAPRYNSYDVDRRVEKSEELSKRVDQLYELRTGHPIGDVLERRIQRIEMERDRRYAQH